MSQETEAAGEAGASLSAQEWKKRVDNASDSGVFDAHACRLSKFPEEILNFKNLKKIFLQNNYIETLPSEIGNFPNLAILYLQENKLHDVPPDLGKLSCLSILALHGNQIRYIPRDLGHCQSLQVLSLSNNRLTQIPLEIGRCNKLKSLDLKDNPDIAVPPAYVIVQGPAKVSEYMQRYGMALTSCSLNLVKFKLRGFPSEITWTGSFLTELDLSNNSEISELPYSISSLSQLRKLWIDKSNLEGRLTQGLGYLTSLTDLSLKSNQITSIPIGLGRATQLKSISLEKNLSMSLPPKEIYSRGASAVLQFLHALVIGEALGQVNLSGLSLTAVDFFHVAVCSHQLHVLQTLPDAGGPWSHLTSLDLSSNKIVSLGSMLELMTNLQQLISSKNRLSEVPETITRLRGLRDLKLDDNAFSSFPIVVCLGDEGVMVEKRSEFGATNNEDFKIDEGMEWKAGQPCQSLELLNLSNNRLSTLNKVVVAVSQLKVLQLANNLLEKLPPLFFNLQLLEELNLSRNRFESIPRDVFQCSSLRRLLLSSNKISEISDSIENLKELRDIDVSNNLIEDIPLQLGALMKLTRANFDGNMLKGVPVNLTSAGEGVLLNFWKAMYDSKKSNKFVASNLGMQDLPNQLVSLTWLDSLDLSKNELLDLKTSVCSLTSLRNLDISHNKIVNLPDEIGNLTNLRLLNISNNRIRRLPMALGLCKGIRELVLDASMIVIPSQHILSLGVQKTLIFLRRMLEAGEVGRLGLKGMQLGEIPKDAWKTIGLQELLIDKNDIVEIDSEVLQMDDLMVLSANMNRLEHLNFLLGEAGKPPWDRARLQLLTRMELRGNLLKEIPTEISKLRALRVLRLDNNNLQQLPNGVCYLTELEVLSVSKNALTRLPEHLSLLAELSVLDVSVNNISSLPFALGRLLDLAKFNIDSNPIREPPVEILRKGPGPILNYLESCHAAISSNSLDVSGLSLYEIPTEVCRLLTLTRLDLSNNRIGVMRQQLVNLSGLEDLNLSENILKEFPLVVCSLTQLSKLNLSYNKFTDMPITIGRLTNLRHLGIEGLKLTRPASEVRELSASGLIQYMKELLLVCLQREDKLDLSSYSFKKFPLELEDLGTQLKSLTLDHNNIPSIPESFSSLRKLALLSVKQNRLQALPHSLKYFGSLKELDVSQNNIVNLPNIVLRSIQKFNADHNSIAEIPPRLCKWTTLKSLSMNNNEVKSLPSKFGQLVHLVSLSFASNRLVVLPKSFAFLSRLKSLNLDSNLLTFLPLEIARLTAITSIRLTDNQVAVLPPQISLCTRIVSLEVSPQHLIVPPPESLVDGVKSMFSYLASLHSASFSDSLLLSNWDLRSFPLDGNFLINLTSLNLSKNKFTSIPDCIESYNNVAFLNLDGNALETLPEQIKNLSECLVDLSICNNRLIRLPKGLFQLTKLVRLSLHHNQLPLIPDLVSTLNRMKLLNLNQNQVKVIPDAFATLSNLQELLLEDNPVTVCNAESFLGCRSLRNLRVYLNYLDYYTSWKKDLFAWKPISGHGVKYPPCEVLCSGPDAVWKYLRLTLQSKTSLSLDLSRKRFWIMEVQDSSRRFYSLPLEVCKLTHLTYLNLSGNFLVKLPGEIGRLTKLEELDLEQNRLKTLPMELSYCRALKRIMLIRNLDLYSPSREIVNQGSNAILGFFLCLYTAQRRDVVRFEGGAYRRFPREFLDLTNVTECYLRNNRIEFVPPEITRLSNLLTLRLDNNSLALLPDELCDMTTLKVLSCSKNLLVALPDRIYRLSGLREFSVNGNFLCDVPPEVHKYGCLLAMDFVQEVKKGRLTAHVDLSNFDLLTFPVDVMRLDRPEGWTRFGIDNYLRILKSETNAKMKRQAAEDRKRQEIEQRRTLGLDLDFEGEFDERDSSWNALEEFCEDAIIDVGTGQSFRRADRLRSLEEVYESFKEWYAFAIGYQSVEEMKENRRRDEDARRVPSEIDLYDQLVLRYGPPEVEHPCKSCIALGTKCHELGTSRGQKRRHKGGRKASRSGWYNIKVRRKHGPEAEWSDDNPNESYSEGSEEEIEAGSGSEAEQFDWTEDVVYYPAEEGEVEESDSDSDDGGETLTEVLSGGAHKYVESLDLSYNLISSIAPQVSALRNLLSLRLSYNTLTLLPPELGKLRSLTNLDIVGNRISYFPNHFSALTSLRVLKISRNEFKLIPDCVRNFTSLRVLSASRNKLVTLSSVLEGCILLEQLWLQENLLTSLHPMIGNLERLNSLNFGRNAITSIPPQLGSCVALTALGIYGNGLSRLPPSLKKLRYLQRLMINHNELLEIPETIVFIRNLTYLNISNNSLSELSSELGKIGSLRSLVADNNKIAQIHPDIVNLSSSLEQLRVENNELDNIDKSLAECTSLTVLNLSTNKIPSLPSEFGLLKNLYKLSVNHNKLVELPEDIGGLEALEYCWFDNNLLTRLPESFGLLTRLVELYLDNNHLHQLCSSFSSLTSLRELYLHNNRFGQPQQNKVGDVLVEAQGIPQEVTSLVNLAVLSVAGNHLVPDMLPQTSSRLTNLTELWLQNNNFEELPACVCDIPNLRYTLLDWSTDATTTTTKHFGKVAFPEEMKQRGPGKSKR